MTTNNQAIKPFLLTCDLDHISLLNELQVLVLSDFSKISSCQRHYNAAFIMSPGIFIVWDDEPCNLLFQAERIENALMETLRHHRPYNLDNEILSPTSGIIASEDVINSQIVLASNEHCRRTILLQPLLTAVTIVVAFTALGSGWRKVATEVMVDFSYVRLAFMGTIPVQLWLGLVCLSSESLMQADVK